MADTTHLCNGRDHLTLDPVLAHPHEATMCTLLHTHRNPPCV